MNANNGLVLYYHHHSFYCQKVIMAMYEKRLPFTTKLVDITKGEQYQSWFLKINPRGEVPVLKDGIKLIPDSVRIIDYLEDNFSNGNHTRLVPMDQGPDVRQKIIQFRNNIDRLPINIITMGSFFNSEFCSGLQYPFVLSSVRKHLKAGEQKSSKSLRQYADKNPEAYNVLMQKANYQDGKHRIVTEKSEYIKVLEQVDIVLNDVEAQLNLNIEKGIRWLCCNDFTIADISLTVLLDRLSRLGLGNYFWSNGKRPTIESYYQRVQRRDSFKNAIPTVVTDIKIIVKSKTRIMIGLITIVAVVVGSVVLLRKK